MRRWLGHAGRSSSSCSACFLLSAVSGIVDREKGQQTPPTSHLIERVNKRVYDRINSYQLVMQMVCGLFRADDKCHPRVGIAS